MGGLFDFCLFFSFYFLLFSLLAYYPIWFSLLISLLHSWAGKGYKEGLKREGRLSFRSLDSALRTRNKKRIDFGRTEWTSGFGILGFGLRVWTWVLGFGWCLFLCFTFLKQASRRVGRHLFRFIVYICLYMAMGLLLLLLRIWYSTFLIG